MQHDVWVQIDLEALKHNLRQVRSAVGDEVKIMAVVKANGYGHGYIEPARAFVDAGADALAVTRIDEALPIRQAGITAPILLLAPVQTNDAEAAVEADLSLTAASLPLAQAISEAAVKLDTTARVHIKIDTGMGRLGVQPGDAPDLMEAITKLPNLHLAGTFTHFAAAAEPDLRSAYAQLHVFHSVLEQIRSRGLDHGLAHAANSAALLRMPESRLHMVRPGTLLFGQYPSRHVPKTLDLKSAFTLKARICEVKHLPAGSSVGYGAEYVTRRPTKTAVVPVGWADGFALAPEGPIYRQSVPAFVVKKMRRRLTAEVNGRKVPIIGRIAMQMTVLDVTGIEVAVGDEVTIPAMRIPTSPAIPRLYL